MGACSGDDGARGPAGPAGADASTNIEDLTDVVSVSRALAATARYLDVNNAIADGYLPTEDCVSAPPGTMGMHYVNPALIGDPAIDAAKPEVVLYLPTENGPKLAAVEYLFALGPPGAPVPAEVPPAPTVFGQEMHGPEEAPAPEVPPHYALHAWVWENNPDGIFADFNPAVSC